MDGHTRMRKVLLGGVGIAAVIALVGATAWACTPQASLKMSAPGGTVGTNVTVTGSTFDASGQDVKVWWGGAGKQLVATGKVTPARSFTATFAVPNAVGGVHIVSATQNDANGQPIAGSPVNTTFRIEGVAAAPSATNLQVEPDNAVIEPVPAAAPAAVTEAAPASAAAPRVRVAPVQRPAAAAPAATPMAAAPAPAAPAPAAPAAPAAVAAPAADVPAPAGTPARRSVMVSMSNESGGSPALAIALVGVGLVLALGASALVLAGRREANAPAKARR